MTTKEMCIELIKTDYQFNLTFHRHIFDEEMKDPNLRFNEKKARAFTFVIEQMKHKKGAKAGEPFILELWQKAVIQIMTGWEKKNSKGKWIRRFRTGLIFIPRKNGKSILGAAIALADDIINQEAENEICCAATKRDQAKIIHEMFWSLISTLPNSVRKNYRHYQSKITLRDGGKCYTLGRDSKTEDGLNVNFALLDELHAAPSSAIMDVVTSSQGARENPFLLVTTTAGFDLGSPLIPMLDHARLVLQGYDQGQDDPEFFAFVAEKHKDTDNFSEEALHQSNPNLGVSVDFDYLRKAQLDAQKRTELRVNFLTKHLNVFTNASEIFVEAEQIKKIMVSSSEYEQYDKTQAKAVTLGLDLSVADDWTAIATTHLFENGRSQGEELKYVIETDYIIPKQDLRERGHRLRVPLADWVRKGYVKTQEQTIIDYNGVFQNLWKKIQFYQDLGIPVTLAYDPYNAKQIVHRLEEKGFTEVFMCAQGFSQSESIVTMKQKIQNETIKIKHNPATIWQFSNIEILTDPYGRLRIDKSNRVKKIDGIDAILNTIRHLLWTQDSDETNEICFV